MEKTSKILIAISWALLIFTAISRPMEYSAYEITFLDKIVHFFMFGILAYLIISAFQEETKKNFKLIAISSFLISTAYAIFTEYWQNFVPGRFSDSLDSLAGVFGIIIFIYLAYFKFKKPKLLLHICCAGCGVFIGQEIKTKYDVTLFFYNPNIFPKEEWKKRLEEVKNICKTFKLKIITEDKYTHKNWLKKTEKLHKEPEGGSRCYVCYEDRLKKTAQKAKAKNFDLFTTTLSVSPHKDAAKILEIGEKLEKKYKIKFLAKDFKKNNGFLKSVTLSKALNLYRQNYCGCEFSRRK